MADENTTGSRTSSPPGHQSLRRDECDAIAAVMALVNDNTLHLGMICFVAYIDGSREKKKFRMSGLLCVQTKTVANHSASQPSLLVMMFVNQIGQGPGAIGV
jgi:hypothetical protein